MITVRELAERQGRAFTLGEKRKPSEGKIRAACPFEYTEPGTVEKDQHHENGRRTAWLRGALDARADHLPASKQVNARFHMKPRAHARIYRHHLTKLEKKGYRPVDSAA